jgi:hypothetical protein
MGGAVAVHPSMSIGREVEVARRLEAVSIHI